MRPVPVQGSISDVMRVCGFGQDNISLFRVAMIAGLTHKVPKSGPVTKHWFSGAEDLFIRFLTCLI